jgi:addiction module RelE/StbE family toxin
MRQIIVHKQFVKQFRKLPSSVQKAFQSRRDLFLEDPDNSLLKIHSLHGSLAGHKSFNVNADMRVVFKEIDEDTCMFVAIGSHSELYE